MAGASFAGLWSRRGFRRLTYALAAGAALSGSLAWTVRQPFFGRWLVRRLDAVLRDETGLGLEAQSLEVHPFEGRAELRNFAVGGDMLRGRRLELSFNPLSFLGSHPHVQRIVLEAPESVLDRERLGRIRLKARPPSAATPQWHIGVISIREGVLQIREPAWGLGQADIYYRAEGHGLGANNVAWTVDVPQLFVDARGGSASFDGRLSETLLDLHAGRLALDGNRVTVRGQYGFKARQLSAEGGGSLDLQRCLSLLDPKQRPAASGRVDFSAQAKGPLHDLHWQLNVHGRELAAAMRDLQPGSLELSAHGTPGQAVVERCLWESLDGRFEATGEWVKGSGSRLSFDGTQISLAPLAPLTRVAFLKELSARLHGNVSLPGDPWAMPRLDLGEVQAECRFTRNGEDAGGAKLDLSKGQLSLEDVNIHVPQVSVRGAFSASLDQRRLRSLLFQGSATTDAEEVAKVLSAWKVVDLNMSGLVRAEARLGWDPEAGISLESQADIEGPRWEGAQADRLHASTSIRNQELHVQDIQLEKGEGRAFGDLWLTWADLPEGAPKIDMCYRADRLPIEEGLKAAALKPERIQQLDMSGQGSGWVRIHGPYSRLAMEGHAIAEHGQVLGFRVPAASSHFSMDLSDLYLQLNDLRVAGSVENLALGDAEPTGLLALRADMRAEIPRGLWDLKLKGKLDTSMIGLGGPHLQAHVDASLAGPWAAPFGPLSLPEGDVRVSHGRLFMGPQSIEGFEGTLALHNGELKADLGVAGKTAPLLTCQAWRNGPLVKGSAYLKVDPDTADTARLAARMTRDLLRDGRLGLSLEGTWGPEGLAWNGKVDTLLAHFEAFDLQTRGDQHLRGDASAANVELLLEGVPRTTGGAAEGSAPAQLRLSGQVPFTSRGGLDLQSQGSVELSHLKTVLDQLLEVNKYSLLSDLKPQGVAGMNLKFGGTYADPSIQGTLSLVDGRLQIRTYPQSIEALDFTLQFQGRDILLPESDPLRGQLAQGDLKAWGKATWDFGGLTNYELNLGLDDFQLRDIPEGFEMSGSLENAVLRGSDRDRGVITGRIKARHMLYRADINLTDLILANALGSANAYATLDPDDPLSRIDLDLNLEMAEPWRFETNLLKLQGHPAGTFKIQGTLARPGLKGKMDFLPGGRLTNLLPAGDVVLERGSMDFTDPRTMNPLLNFQGRVDVPPYLVNLNINGSLDQLNFVPTSTPSLRQDEIVAILVDPGMAQSIGTTSGSSSQTAMAQGLASTGSGLLTTLAFASFQERIRKTFNLDRVSVAWRTGSAGTPETNITLGKTINLFGRPTPWVFTHRKAGELVTLSGQFEWRLGNFVLQLGASQTGNAGMGIAGEIRHTWIPK